MRHQATLQLREAAHGADPEALVLAEDIRRHGYGELSDRPGSPKGSRRVKHWKTPFWKRRTSLRAQRWQLANADLDL